jgi:hypothetical protein
MAQILACIHPSQLNFVIYIVSIVIVYVAYVVTCVSDLHPNVHISSQKVPATPGLERWQVTFDPECVRWKPFQGVVFKISLTRQGAPKNKMHNMMPDSVNEGISFQSVRHDWEWTIMVEVDARFHQLDIPFWSVGQSRTGIGLSW